MKRLITSTALLIMFSVTIFAQTPTGAIKGKIIDGGSQAIIDAATVSLFHLQDSSLVKINLTDKDGNFIFENVNPGKYYLLATSTGRLKVYSPALEVTNNLTVSAGILQLKEDVKTLKEVSVAVKKQFIERKIDRTVINVESSITSAGSTALEVLEKAPGVTVDKDGIISLKGKQGVIVMMDGRPSYLSGQQLASLLKALPSSTIDQIEIMTNPSAKFDAAGNSGVINIKTKKNKMKGFNGSVSLGYIQGKFARTNNSLNLNYRTGKINIFGNYSYSYWHRKNETYIIRNFRDNQTKLIETIFDQKGISENRSTDHDAKLGFDFYATKKTTFGAVFTGDLNPGEDNSTNNSFLKNAYGEIDSIVVSKNDEKKKNKNFGVNLNLLHSFDSTGKQFTVDLDYVVYDNGSDQLLQSLYYMPDFTTKKPSSFLKGDLPSKVNIYSGKTDFTFPLKNSAKLEAGLKSSYVTTDNNALYKFKTTGDYVTDYGKTNHFIFKENINAAYANYNKEIGKWGMQLGLRAEDTHSNGHQLGNGVKPDSLFTKDYFNLFPTMFISYKVNDNNTFSANYGRRVDRPQYEDLNPFFYFLDEYTYQVGNTLLQPQFTNNFELMHIYKGFLSTTLNYSKTNDAFADVIKQITSERKTFVTKENIATKTNVGIAVSANFPVGKFLNTNIYTNVSNTKYDGDIDGSNLSLGSATFMGNMSNQFKFEKGWSAELSGFYRSKGIEGQIIINPMWRMDAGVQKQILKKKGSLKLSVRDIFKTQNMSAYVKYNDIDLRIKDIRDSRSVSLTFSYRFGKPIKSPQRQTGGASDEQSRVK
ncbi:MAG: TonB-dependent receptor [Ginsengibacter sp.]